MLCPTYQNTRLPMCIAILNGGKQLPKKKLQNCWNNNDDGAGMLYLSDGVLVAEKFGNDSLVNSSKNFDKFYQRYVDIKSGMGDVPMLLHFRIATHGFTDEFLHPFFVSPDLGLIHNGVITGFGSKDKSDTAEFTELLSSMPGMTTCEMLDIPFVEDAIYMYLGVSNKLVFLDSTGDFRIFNEDKGQWIGENWFSNDSHSKAVRYYGSTAVYKDAYDDYGLDAWTGGWDGGNKQQSVWPSKYTDSFIKGGKDGMYHSNLQATEKLYHCPQCKDAVAVNYDAECTECYCYLPDAVNDVMELWEKYDYDSDTFKSSADDLF